MKRILSIAVLLMGMLWIGGCGDDDSPTRSQADDMTMEFVWIEPGTFMMGAPQNEIDQLNMDFDTDYFSNEGPQHEVTIRQGFWLGKYEITQGQWEKVMGTTPWAGQAKVAANPSHPAVYISWNDVQEFIHNLNEAEGDSLYRLPTEAEWEYACRAGTTTRWSFGDDENRFQEYAWCWDNAWYLAEKQYAHAVGTKLPNPWGLYDMHGNVYEWCQDWYDTYTSSAQTDPTGSTDPVSGTVRVFRGGGFYSGSDVSRSTSRDYYAPGNRGYGIGARLLRIGPQ